jgi:DNA-3-methyladenine glycosylase
MKLGKSFYVREDVVQIAKELLGKTLITFFNEQRTGGIITETEAYAGVIDKASHAYGGRRTERTEIMYADGGTAYVYLCYGIHSLFNVVTNKKGTPHAVLIRSIVPTEGIEIIENRRKQKLSKNIAVGPGKVSQALGIHYTHTGMSLKPPSPRNNYGDAIWIVNDNPKAEYKNISVGPRVGVNYAGDHAAWPYRFQLDLNN